MALLLLAMPLSMSLASNVRFLIVYGKDGTYTSFALAEEPKVTFTGGELCIESSSSTFSMSLADVQNYTFSVESTGISEAIKEGNVKLENGFVVFSGFAEGSRVTVNTLEGKLVSERKTDSEGSAVLDLSGLPKGILLIHSNKTSIKVINR